MEPLCHTLMGAALGEAGLKRGSALASATLVIGANLPDLDAVMYVIATDLSFSVRRGWTHGVLAMLLLPWLLGLVMWWIGKLNRDRDPPGRESSSLPFSRFLGLSYVGVISHPALDWLNVYGIRLLMPFSPRWFYGDALFIVDPWVWLMLGGPMLWIAARSAAKPTTSTSQGIRNTKGRALGWFLLRLSGGHRGRRERVVRISLAIACLYMIAMAAGSRVVEHQARRWLASQGTSVVDVAALPVLLNPFVRDVVVLERDAYEFVIFDALSSPPFTKSGGRAPRNEPDAIVHAALRSPRVQGLRTWMRFPSYDVETRSDGYRVEIRDVRFARQQAGGFGSAVVVLDRNLRPVAGSDGR